MSDVQPSKGSKPLEGSLANHSRHFNSRLQKPIKILLIAGNQALHQMKDKLLDRFRSLFWDAFHVPDLQTEKYKQVWQQLEPLNDQVAGPMFSIFEKGNCDYILEDEERFSSIKTPDDLFEKLVDLIKDYGEKAAAVSADSEEEKKDLQVLLYQADIKMELAELALEVLKAEE